ncbi:MAG: B12-binding domain-containing radical SAM protein [Candidatus Micrarchaeota archaeon]|nr:B12-binding domain-containing radical SAM protein [Candidatus Micrarchaeota archaeon]
MTKYVLVSDNTLIHNFRNFPLLDFLPSAPASHVPGPVYKFLRGVPAPALPDGQAKFAPYGMRKLEISMLNQGIKSEDIAVAHPDHLQNFIKDDTEIVAVHTMDPMGLGPTTMSYYALFGGNEMRPWVRQEWDDLLAKINALRVGKKAKLMIGGPGVWEYTILNEEIERHKVDYLFQGEADDIGGHLFQQLTDGQLDPNMFNNGFITYDETFHRMQHKDPRFISRGSGIGAYPKLEDIPVITKPTTKGLTEVMRGCGIGCDFCEVTLRPLRYYPIDMIVKELKVNLDAGYNYAWMHSDEIFAYKHLQNYVPNQEALIELFSTVMAQPGVVRTNPTHGRISIPAAYPELIKKLSEIGRASSSNWIGVQVGLETGSDRLAKLHMPAKTLPLKIGVDGSYQEIVWKGVYNFNKYFWRPAFTVQVGQSSETDEDNWETVALINRMSNSVVEGRPFEFTVTPLYNMPLGRIKAKQVKSELTPSMLAVYYASYRHLAKMASRNANKDSKGNPFVKVGTSKIISVGGGLMFKAVEKIAKKQGLDVEKAKNWGMPKDKELESWAMVAKAM